MLSTSLKVSNLRKAAVLHLPFSLSSVAGAVPNSACRSLSITVVMTSSHGLLIIHSPHETLKGNMGHCKAKTLREIKENMEQSESKERD
jgi:hypothetical protein